MKYLSLIIVVLSFFVEQSFAQDTLFYNHNFFTTDSKSKATYFSIQSKEKVDSSKYSVTKNYLNGQVAMELFFLNKKLQQEKTYYENGQLKWSIDFENEEYKKIVSYWKKGQLKRTDIFEKGKLIDGKCFDPVGKQILHSDFEVMPSFPGGEDSLGRFLSNLLQFPKDSKGNYLKGKVIVGFIVNKEGIIDEIKIEKGVCKELDEEAIRVVKLIPKWQPGKQDGNPVDVWFTLPINFELED